MKIIEEKPFKWEFTCKKCGSVLEADEGDVQISEFGGYDDTRYVPNVICPVCDEIEEIPWEKLSPKVEAKARKKGRVDR